MLRQAMATLTVTRPSPIQPIRRITPRLAPLLSSCRAHNRNPSAAPIRLATSDPIVACLTCDIRFHRLSSSAVCRLSVILATAVPPAAATNGIVTGRDGPVTRRRGGPSGNEPRNRPAARHSVVPI